MPDVFDLPDLADEVRGRVVVPPYDEVSRRVRARRRRGAVGTIAAAVLVVGGVAAWQGATSGPSTREPQPASSSAPIPMTDESMWRSVVGGEQAGVYGLTGTDDGSVAVLWRDAGQPTPTFALVIREADGTVHGRRLDDALAMTPVPGGWVGLTGLTTTRGWFIGSDGSMSDLGPVSESRSARAGDVLVSGPDGLWVYSPDDRSWAPMHFDGVAEGIALTGSGDQVTCAEEGDGIVVRRDAHEVARVAGQACVVVGQGDVLAAVGLGDGPGGDIPLAGFARSTDGGATWTKPATRELSEVTSVAVLDDGTTVVTGAGDSFVIHADGSYSEPEVPLGAVVAAGDVLYATTYAQDKAPLLTSDDGGYTWTETPLPGTE